MISMTDEELVLRFLNHDEEAEQLSRLLDDPTASMAANSRFRSDAHVTLDPKFISTLVESIND